MGFHAVISVVIVGLLSAPDRPISGLRAAVSLPPAQLMAAPTPLCDRRRSSSRHQLWDASCRRRRPLTPDTRAEQFGSLQRVNSIVRETNGSFDSCNWCIWLVPSRLHELVKNYDLFHVLNLYVLNLVILVMYPSCPDGTTGWGGGRGWGEGRRGRDRMCWQQWRDLIHLHPVMMCDIQWRVWTAAPRWFATDESLVQ